MYFGNYNAKTIMQTFKNTIFKEVIINMLKQVKLHILNSGNLNLLDGKNIRIQALHRYNSTYHPCVKYGKRLKMGI